MGKIKRFLAGLALLSFELFVILLLFVISLFAFAYITIDILDLHDPAFDREVFAALVPFINDTATRIMVTVSFFASQNFLLPANILLVIYFLLLRRHRWYSIRIPVVSLGSFVVMSGTKLFFQRARPLDPVYEAARGFSYPSGHAMSAMTFYGLLIFIVWDKIENKGMRWLLTIVLSVWILLIGFSRIYLRVHYTSDVLAGFALGLIWLVLSLRVMYQIEKYTKREIAPAVNNEA